MLVTISGQCDARLLAVPREKGVLWAWFGSRRALDPQMAREMAQADISTESTLAIGEPGEGIAGWRLTHHQADAALGVALRGRESVVCYRDVILLAAVRQNDLAVTSLRRLYSDAFEGSRGDGQVLRETLRVYYATEQNVSSTASALGVTRQTVTNRLNAVASRLGRPLTSCGAELMIALGLMDLKGLFPTGKKN